MTERQTPPMRRTPTRWHLPAITAVAFALLLPVVAGCSKDSPEPDHASARPSGATPTSAMLASNGPTPLDTAQKGETKEVVLNVLGMT